MFRQHENVRVDPETSPRTPQRRWCEARQLSRRSMCGRSFEFLILGKKRNKISNLFVDLRTEREHARVVPYRYGARSDGHAAWNGTRRSAKFAGPGRFQDLLFWRRTGRTTAKGADGTSECPGVSTHERGEWAQAADPGASSKPTNPSVCGAQAKGCFRGPGSVQRPRSMG